MPKKVIQYKVGYETYSARWVAETIATLIQDGYLNNDYLNLTYVKNGFRINYKPDYNQIIFENKQSANHGDQITITVKESELIEVVQDKTTATSEEILKLIKKGWAYTYNGKNIYNIPVKTNLNDTLKEVMIYFIKNLTINPLQHTLEITEQIYYKTHDELFENKNLAHIFEDIVANKKLEIKNVDPMFGINVAWPVKRINIAVNENYITIKTELRQNITTDHILKYDELGYDWSTDGKYSTWKTKTKSVNRQLFAKVLRDIDLLLEKD